MTVQSHPGDEKLGVAYIVGSMYFSSFKNFLKKKVV